MLVHDDVYAQAAPSRHSRVRVITVGPLFGRLGLITALDGDTVWVVLDGSTAEQPVPVGQVEATSQVPLHPVAVAVWQWQIGYEAVARELRTALGTTEAQPLLEQAEAASEEILSERLNLLKFVRTARECGQKLGSLTPASLAPFTSETVIEQITAGLQATLNDLEGVLLHLDELGGA